MEVNETDCLSGKPGRACGRSGYDGGSATPSGPEAGVAMTTLLFHHECAAGHDTGPGHPERAARAGAVAAALDAPDFRGLERREPPEAGREALERAHSRDYVDLVLGNMPERGYVRFDADTVASPGTKDAALRAAGAAVAAVDALVGGEADTAFCAMRPPGHHAEPARAMGFCFFNSVAVGAAHARAVHGLGRVAVVDFDVHHGNGTQAVFWDEPEVLFASTHQMPLYPGTGAERESGAHGQVVNAPLPPGAGGKAFRKRFEGRVLPAVEAFRPELVLVSAGFDAHRADPLAQLELEAADFAWATRRLLAVACRHAGGRLAAGLEGGYDLAALEECVGVHVTALAGG